MATAPSKSARRFIQIIFDYTWALGWSKAALLMGADEIERVDEKRERKKEKIQLLSSASHVCACFSIHRSRVQLLKKTYKNTERERERKKKQKQKRSEKRKTCEQSWCRRMLFGEKTRTQSERERGKNTPSNEKWIFFRCRCSTPSQNRMHGRLCNTYCIEK